MAGFVRRYGYFPGTEVITLIEGIIIVDLPPPGVISGVGTGTVAMVGEYPDVTNAVAVSNTGIVTTNVQPVEVFSAQDMLSKVGGFDPTLGEFGNSGGNAFAELRNKRFSRLICVPINIASGGAGRMWRELPTNLNGTTPQPIIPVGAAGVDAGTEFKNGASRVRSAKAVAFTGFGAYAASAEGKVTNAGAPAEHQAFKVGVAVSIGSLARSTNVVTATVSAHNFHVGDVVEMISAGEANFANGKKVITTVGTTTFTYYEAGSDVVSGAIQTFSLFNLLTAKGGGPVTKGDVLALGVLGVGSAGTYRVQATALAADSVEVEQMDGSSFDWSTATLLPWRIHPGSDADTATAPAAYGDDAGFSIPCRPLDADIAASTKCLPTLAAAAGSASFWDPLSGLTLLSHSTNADPNVVGFKHVSNLQDPNVAANATLDAAYQAAIDGLLGDAAPARDANVMLVARTSATIRNKQRAHVLTSSSEGVGRTTVVWPNLKVLALNTALLGSDPGVGATRDERVDYSWPGAMTSVPEAVGYALGTSDGHTTTDGLLDVSGANWLGAVLSNLPPENNPGQAAPPVPDVMASVIGLQRGAPNLKMSDYIAMRSNGICGLHFDRTTGGFIFQSGITSSLISGKKNINRRRFADFIEDSVAGALQAFTKLPLTKQLKDSAVGELVGFGETLLSRNNPPAQRIADYIVDDKSGNTTVLSAQGIWVIIFKVQMLATGDFIVAQCEVGLNSLRVTTT